MIPKVAYFFQSNSVSHCSSRYFTYWKLLRSLNELKLSPHKGFRLVCIKCFITKVVWQCCFAASDHWQLRTGPAPKWHQCPRRICHWHILTYAPNCFCLVMSVNSLHLNSGRELGFFKLAKDKWKEPFSTTGVREESSSIMFDPQVKDL